MMSMATVDPLHVQEMRGATEIAARPRLHTTKNDRAHRSMTRRPWLPPRRCTLLSCFSIRIEQACKHIRSAPSPKGKTSGHSLGSSGDV